jgi:hypothetical protein
MHSQTVKIVYTNGHENGQDRWMAGKVYAKNYQRPDKFAKSSSRFKNEKNLSILVFSKKDC